MAKELLESSYMKLAIGMRELISLYRPPKTNQKIIFDLNRYNGL
jgi:hypothetical protein